MKTTRRENLWPGNFASRVGMQGERNWPAKELLRQIEITRATEGASGNVLFSMKSLFDDYGPLGQQLKRGPYARPALVPALPNAPAVARPQLVADGAHRVATLPQNKPAWLWLTWQPAGDDWSVAGSPGSRRLTMEENTVAVAAVNRYGNISAAATLSPSPKIRG